MPSYEGRFVGTQGDLLKQLHQMKDHRDALLRERDELLAVVSVLRTAVERWQAVSAVLSEIPENG